MDLILAHVFNRMSGRHGVVYPTCRPCFDTTGRRWAETLTLRLDKVIAPEAEPHPGYNPHECFFCHRRGNPQQGNLMK